jgi:hypothetical protein
MMSERPLTPEEVIGEMSVAEVQELLSDLRLDSSQPAAIQLKQMVRALGDFETAIEAFSQPPATRKAA